MHDQASPYWNGVPPERVFAVLAAAKRAKRPFAEAWDDAMGAVAALRCPDGGSWPNALAKTRGGWRRAFENAPAPRREAACGELRERFRELADLTLAERVCEHCGEPISPDRDPRARFCSDSHRWAAARLPQARTDRPDGPIDVRAGLPDPEEAIQTAA